MSRDKLKTYLYHHNAYGHKIYQRSDITQRAPNQKFACLLNEVVIWGHVTNILYLHLKKTHEYQTTQGADLQWEAPILKVTWPFDHVANVRSRNNFENLYFHYQNSYGQ